MQCDFLEIDTIYMTLVEKLQWRYAAKKMDPTQVVPQDKVDRIVEAMKPLHEKLSSRHTTTV